MLPSLDDEQMSTDVSCKPECGCQSRLHARSECPVSVMMGLLSGSENRFMDPDHEDVANWVAEGWIEIEERGLSHAY